MKRSRTKQDVMESAWNDIKMRLEARKAQIFSEIRNYPPPITACDEQFDHLLAEQERVSRALRRLDKLATKRPPHGNPANLVEEFLAATDSLEAETKQQLKASLNQGLANLKS